MILRVLHPGGSTALLFLQGPITVIEAQATMSRLCDATGREYFFNADGSYDGFGQATERIMNADSAEILSSERSTSGRPRDETSSALSDGRAAALDAAPSPPPEICICAAIVTENGQVIRGHWHADCMRTAADGRLKPRSGHDAQGFITSRNRYVTRAEAARLQIAAGIPSADPSAPYLHGECYSEDLYLLDNDSVAAALSLEAARTTNAVDPSAQLSGTPSPRDTGSASSSARAHGHPFVLPDNPDAILKAIQFLLAGLVAHYTKARTP